MNLIKISVIPVVLAIVFSLCALIGCLIQMLLYKLRYRDNPPTNFYKYHLAVHLAVHFAGAVLLLNLFIMKLRFPNYPAYSSLRINLMFNLLYVVLAVAYLGLLIYKLRKSSYSKKQKVMYIMSGISALILAAFIVGWNLYV